MTTHIPHKEHSEPVHDEGRRLSGQDAKTLSLSALGGALEFYDFVIYVFFSTVVGTLFFPSDMPDWMRNVQTFGIFAAGYLARPLGGVIMAHFGDLLGRKKMFMFSIFLMAVPTLLMGLLPTYETIGIAAPLLLLLMRVLQGAAIGGEAPGAWVFVTEHVPRRHINFACGSLSCGLVGGILLGSIIATLINAFFSASEINDWAWRLPFILGGVLGFVTMYLRRWLHETPVFAEMQARKTLSEELPVKRILTQHGSSVVLSMGVTWLLTAAVVVTVLMTPPLLKQVTGIDAQLMQEANTISIVFVMIGCLVAGFMADRFGAGKVLALFSLGLAITYGIFYSSMLKATDHVFSLYALSGFFVGLVGVVPGIAVSSFPAAIRFTGLSFSYNVAYAIFGGLTPMGVSFFMAVDPLAPVYYIAFIGVLGVMIGVWATRRAQAHA
ncbi:MFS transporter [Larsenimonas suaedae]|uniref:MFS transporter n=1 Tax=Larsenimonas suaedae TaxID=1851019 RepID=A0ABU1GTB3_9GAMM|nr:MFS transporter [Larsenimonas suaedae]MCM2971715.1 MFS transporter [Larsenimonas suaedae]MDR5895267.1 MFS transporter [Larsenimonas suaedae]